MAASFLASFLIFLLTGMYVLYGGLGFAEDTGIKVFVSLALLFNAIFYHYVAAFTEMEGEMCSVLETARVAEWWVRVVNQCLLLSLWFWLEQGWTRFGVSLLLLYLSFLLWDWLTWSHLKKHRVFWLDLIGLFLSLLYFLAGYVVLGEFEIEPGLDRTFYFFFGTLSLAYLTLPVIGVRLLRFNPFRREYWQRPKLH